MDDHPDYRDEKEPAPEILLPMMAKSIGEWAAIFDRYGILTGDCTMGLEIIQVHEVWDNDYPQRRSGLYLIHSEILQNYAHERVPFERTLDSVYIYDDGDGS